MHQGILILVTTFFEIMKSFNCYIHVFEEAMLAIGKRSPEIEKRIRHCFLAFL